MWNHRIHLVSGLTNTKKKVIGSAYKKSDLHSSSNVDVVASLTSALKQGNRRSASDLANHNTICSLELQNALGSTTRWMVWLGSTIHNRSWEERIQLDQMQLFFELRKTSKMFGWDIRRFVIITIEANLILEVNFASCCLVYRAFDLYWSFLFFSFPFISL